jgi:hypothetical protein
VNPPVKSPDEVLHDAEELRWQLPQNLHDRIAESIYGEAARLAERNITRSGESRRMAWQQKLDRLLTNPWTSFPIMILVLGLILWVTIVGANVPSAILSKLLVNDGHALLSGWLMLFSLCHNPCTTPAQPLHNPCTTPAQPLHKPLHNPCTTPAQQRSTPSTERPAAGNGLPFPHCYRW